MFCAAAHVQASISWLGHPVSCHPRPACSWWCVLCSLAQTRPSSCPCFPQQHNMCTKLPACLPPTCMRSREHEMCIHTKPMKIRANVRTFQHASACMINSARLHEDKLMYWMCGTLHLLLSGYTSNRHDETPCLGPYRQLYVHCSCIPCSHLLRLKTAFHAVSSIYRVPFSCAGFSHLNCCSVLCCEGTCPCPANSKLTVRRGCACLSLQACSTICTMQQYSLPCANRIPVWEHNFTWWEFDLHRVVWLSMRPSKPDL